MQFDQTSAPEEQVVTQSKIIGLLALSVGGVLLFFAWSASNAPLDQISEGLTDRSRDDVMQFLLSGLLGVVTGSALLYLSFSRD